LDAAQQYEGQHRHQHQHANAGGQANRASQAQGDQAKDSAHDRRAKDVRSKHAVVVVKEDRPYLIASS